MTLRELNRATLARQLLLERSDLDAVSAIEQLAGLQAHATCTRRSSIACVRLGAVEVAQPAA